MVKKYYITTYGCQANAADSENLAGMLEALGMLPAEGLTEADLVIVNTCSVRQASEDKVYGLANKIKDLKTQNSELKTVLTGCLVGSATSARPRIGFEDLRRRTPWVDHYLNINELASLPAYLLSCGLVDEWAIKAIRPDRSASGFARLIPGVGEWEPKAESHDGVAYINISQGCDNFCTFCVVPYSRGKEVSRSEEEILAQVRRVVARGYRKVMLLGQNVNSWGLTAEKKLLSRKHIGRLPFASLLRKIHAVEGLETIKFITSNPFDFTPDLSETLRLPKVDRYLHLPVQSGDDEILRRMGRRHRRDDYLELVGEIRSAVAEIELGTDIIVGFPGETEEQFLSTVDLVKQVGFNVVFIALYSPRPGTPSARLFKDDVTRDEKRRRYAYLNQVWQESKGRVKLAIGAKTL